MIAYNNQSGLTAICFDSHSIVKAYCGANEVWSSASPTPSAKWVARYADSSVSSAECNSATAIGNNEITKTNLVSVEIGDCVTSISAYTFSGCTSLTSITIPNSVTSIGSWVFADCSGLTNVTLPSGLTSISDYFFDNCYNLSSVAIPSGVTSIGKFAFAGCRSLTTIDIPNSVNSIGSHTFVGCSGLTSVTIPSGVTSIGQWCFTNCSSLSAITCEAVTPPTLEGDYTFDNTNNCPIYVPCQSLETYKAAWSDYTSRIQCLNPTFEGKFKAEYQGGQIYSAACDSNTTLTSGNTHPSGYDYTRMTSAIVGGNCVTSIGNGAFNGFSGLTSIDIPNSITTIGLKAFSQCRSLTSITIPSGVTSIGQEAFYMCWNLPSVTIPSSVTSISFDAFYSCTGLTSITCEAVTPPTLANVNVFYQTNDCPIYVPSGSVETYKAASGWSTYASRIEAIS